jgi:glycosyltransferase involved in cell wall biosynthesis
MTSDTQPLVTVLLPVYNGEPFLGEAIDSIIHQTFTAWRLLILNDASTDRSLALAQSYTDSRIIIVNNPANLGLTATLNKGIDLTHTRYLARMDADDRCLPERFAKQVAYMEEHPEVGVCGTWLEYLESGLIIRRPTAHRKFLHFMLTKGCPFFHPTVLLRTAIIKEHCLYYDPAYEPAEDFELWARLIKITQFANLPEILLQYRAHPNQISTRRHQEQQLKTHQIIKSLRNYFVY